MMESTMILPTLSTLSLQVAKQYLRMTSKATSLLWPTLRATSARPRNDKTGKELTALSLRGTKQSLRMQRGATRLLWLGHRATSASPHNDKLDKELTTSSLRGTKQSHRMQSKATGSLWSARRTTTTGLRNDKADKELTALSLQGTTQSHCMQSKATRLLWPAQRTASTGPRNDKVFIVTFLLLVILLPFNSFSQKLLFPKHPGVVSYTYRNYLSNDVAAGLDLIKGNGFTDIEFSSLFSKTAAELKAMLDERHLKCSSFGVSYDDLVNKTAEVAQNAKTLGAEYVRVAGIPHKGDFTLTNAQQAVADFNRYGKILKEQYGLSFIYHNHGFEFQPYQGGTLYDYLVTHTDSKYVSLELDILWAFFPGQDPAALINKYGKRYQTMHLKDLKKGVATGSLAGGTDQDNDVALGTGQIDIAAVLRAAKKAGIRHYYIEDESTHVLSQVPQSIHYINSITQ